MKAVSLFLLVLALTACAEPHGKAAPAYLAAATTSSMPPRRVADCITYVLLDNKCTADWYKCSDGGEHGHCRQAWADCCTLPGNKARTTIVTAPQTTQSP
jgi:hypothetical protein